MRLMLLRVASHRAKYFGSFYMFLLGFRLLELLSLWTAELNQLVCLANKNIYKCQKVVTFTKEKNKVCGKKMNESSDLVK